MLETKKYTISELRQVLGESTEFKAKKGPSVDKENKENNDKAVKDILTQTKKMNDTGVSKKRKTTPEDVVDYNRTTLDVEFVADPGKDYTERVKAQVHGFPSAENEKNSEMKDDGGSDLEGNKKFYDDDRKKMSKLSDEKATGKHAGLKAREYPKDKFKSKTLFKNENKTMKRLHFKNTVFLTEEQMLKKVPDEYKTDGNRFLMRDNTGTDYVVECTVDDNFGYTKLNVVNKLNKKAINEELNRMKSLYEYKDSNYNKGTSASLREGADKVLGGMIHALNETKQ